MTQFSEPIICALCGVVLVAFDHMFMAGVSLGIAGFAAACIAAEKYHEGD
jgi:hypothetical protein